VGEALVEPCQITEPSWGTATSPLGDQYYGDR
jgi:hypothetical protein